MIFPVKNTIILPFAFTDDIFSEVHLGCSFSYYVSTPSVSGSGLTMG